MSLSVSAGSTVVSAAAAVRVTGGDGISCKHGLQLDCNPGAPACVFYTVITDRSPPKRFGVLLHRKTPI